MQNNNETPNPKPYFIIQDRESGNFIDQFETEKDALTALLNYEDQDIADGNYTPDFYEIIKNETND